MNIGSVCRSVVARSSLLSLCLGASVGLQAANTDEERVLQPKALLHLRNLTQLEYSNERNAVLFVVSETAEHPGGLQSIWYFDQKLFKARQLSVKAKVNSQPQWCPGSNCLTFVSDRDGKRALYRLSMAGGEAEKISRSGTDISAYDWSASEDMLAYIANFSDESASPADNGQAEPGSAIEESFTVVGIERQQLWLLDVANGKASQLTNGDWRISSLHWIPGSKRIVLSASSDVESELEHDRLFVIDSTDGKMRELWRPDREITNIEVSPDGKFVAAIAARESGPEPFDLLVIAIDGGQTRNLTASTIDRQVLSFKWRENDTLLAVVAEGFQSVLYELSLDKAARRLADPPVAPGSDIAVGEDYLAFVGSAFVQPSELWVSDPGNSYRKATSINIDLTNVELLPAPKIIRYESFDGVTIEAALYVPDAGAHSAPYPLIAHIHGGPSARWANEFRPSWAALLASRGFAVIEPNVRGSTGGTYEFLIMNRNDLGGGDFKDILAGVDHLVETGVADPNRLGIAGWSYGGYMAAWAVTQTDRFKAAVSGAPVTNWTSEYGTESAEVNRYDRALLGGLYGNMDLFARISPLTYVHNANTPTQLLCAEDDTIDPIGQCWEFYRGLQQNHVRSELIIYKEVGHDRFVWSSKQQVDSMQRMLSWFEHFFK